MPSAQLRAPAHGVSGPYGGGPCLPCRGPGWVLSAGSRCLSAEWDQSPREAAPPPPHPTPAPGLSAQDQGRGEAGRRAPLSLGARPPWARPGRGSWPASSPFSVTLGQRSGHQRAVPVGSAFLHGWHPGASRPTGPAAVGSAPVLDARPRAVGCRLPLPLGRTLCRGAPTSASHSTSGSTLVKGKEGARRRWEGRPAAPRPPRPPVLPAPPAPEGSWRPSSVRLARRSCLSPYPPRQVPHQTRGVCLANRCSPGLRLGGMSLSLAEVG